MYQKLTYLLFLLALGFGQTSAQTVSTLINDPSRSFEAIHWHEDGRIYAVDFNNGRVYQIFLDGTVETLITDIANAAGGGFGENGNFYYSEFSTGTIFQLTPDGTVSTIATGLSQPTGILQSSFADTLFVGQYGNNSVIKVSISTGEKVPFAAGNGINGPDAVINDGEGNLIVANFNDHMIHKVSPDGTVSNFATLPFQGFTGYINKVGGYFYVPSFEGRRIYRLSTDGMVELFAGTGEQGNSDGMALEATFDAPNGVTGNLAGDTMLITDEGTVRMITNLEGTTNTTSAVQLLQKLQLSPNPAADQLSVIFDLQTTSKLAWRIFDQAGKLVLQNTLQNLEAGAHQLQIDIRHLPKGMYTFHLGDGHDKGNQQPFLVH